MSWREEYRAKREEEEEIVFGQFRDLQAEVGRLERELKRRRIRTVLVSLALAAVVITIWYYTRH